jgi:hypothetical protein
MFAAIRMDNSALAVSAQLRVRILMLRVVINIAQHVQIMASIQPWYAVLANTD